MGLFDVFTVSEGLNEVSKNIKNAQDKALEIEVIKLKANDNAPEGSRIEWTTNAMGLPVAKVVPFPDDPRIKAKQLAAAQENAQFIGRELLRLQVGQRIDAQEDLRKSLIGGVQDLSGPASEPFKQQLRNSLASTAIQAMQSGDPEQQRILKQQADTLLRQNPEEFNAVMDIINRQTGLSVVPSEPGQVVAPGPTAAARPSAFTPLPVPSDLQGASVANAVNRAAQISAQSDGDFGVFMSNLQQIGGAQKPTPVQFTPTEAAILYKRVFGREPVVEAPEVKGGQVRQKLEAAASDIQAVKSSVLLRLEQQGIKDAIEIVKDEKGRPQDIVINPNIIKNPEAIDALVSALKSAEDDPRLASLSPEARKQGVTNAVKFISEGLRPLVDPFFNKLRSSVVTAGRPARKELRISGDIKKNNVVLMPRRLEVAQAFKRVVFGIAPGFTVPTEKFAALVRLKGLVDRSISAVSLVDSQGSLVATFSAR